MPNYSLLDQPELLRYLFFPRKDFTACPPNAFDLFVPSDGDVSIHCRFYAARSAWPWVLLFHGNGEVVSDYDIITPLYHQKDINLAVAEYRGYGASGGTPAFAHLIKDAHCALKAVKAELDKKGFGEGLYLMGRSMGSVCALELAYHHPDKIRGLIIESGFASVTRLIKHLGLPCPHADLAVLEEECLEMAGKISVPVLIIHGQEDHLVPVQEARDLFACLGTKQKDLVIIPGAGHNDIMLAGFERYFNALKRFTDLRK